MNDSPQAEPDELDISPGAGTRSARRDQARSRASALGLLTAVVAALVAGPSLASHLSSTGASPGEPYPDLYQVAQEPAVPTTTPENANRRESRTPSATPAPTGENANQREGRTWQRGCP